MIDLQEELKGKKNLMELSNMYVRKISGREGRDFILEHHLKTYDYPK